MRISPAGTRREMVAQSFTEAAPDYNNGMLGMPETGPKTQALSPTPAPSPVQSQTPKLPEQDDKTSDDTDIKSYVAKKLEAFGYPPRRLEEFEDDFVTQKLYPGGVREITIVVPDRYYSTRKSISDADFGKILQEIQQQFGLSFVDGERKEKKIEIHFTSEKPSLNDEEVPVGDELDEVYGKQTTGGEEKKRTRVRGKPVRRAASKETAHELIKKSLEDLCEKLLRIGREKNSDTESI